MNRLAGSGSLILGNGVRYRARLNLTGSNPGGRFEPVAGGIPDAHVPIDRGQMLARVGSGARDDAPDHRASLRPTAQSH